MKKVLIAGGSGLVGSRLVSMLKEQYEIRILTRSPQVSDGNISYWKWDLNSMEIQDGAVEVDHIINLNGAGIADQRWSNARKKTLIDSRIKSNQLLATTLEKAGVKLASFSCASAIGYYGDRGNENLTETSPPGNGFLSECCQKWEGSADLLTPYAKTNAKIRVGLVLSTKGGALPKILMTKNLGVLSYFGNGSQYYSWIHIDDLCKIFIATLYTSGYQGTINGVSPTSLTNKEFIADVKKGANSNALMLPAPEFALRLAMGEMADVVLNSNKVIPQKLNELNHSWEYPNLKQAIKDLIDRDI